MKKYIITLLLCCLFVSSGGVFASKKIITLVNKTDLIMYYEGQSNKFCRVAFQVPVRLQVVTTSPCTKKYRNLAPNKTIKIPVAAGGMTICFKEGSDQNFPKTPTKKVFIVQAADSPPSLSVFAIGPGEPSYKKINSFFHPHPLCSKVKLN